MEKIRGRFLHELRGKIRYNISSQIAALISSAN